MTYPRTLALLAVLATLGTSSPAPAADPKAPPGIDPGGVAVAIVSTGLDYTVPEIAARLARDGEGEMVGFDFTDSDPWPFDKGGAGTALAQALVAEAPGARIVPLRTSAGGVMSLGSVTAFLTKSPAKVAVVALPWGDLAEWGTFLRAARFVPGTVFIVPEGTNVRPAPQIETIVVVGAAAGAKADVAVAVKAGSGRPAEAGAARAAALAVRILEKEPRLDGAELRRRLIAMAGQGKVIPLE